MLRVFWINKQWWMCFVLPYPVPVSPIYSHFSSVTTIPVALAFNCLYFFHPSVYQYVPIFASVIMLNWWTRWWWYHRVWIFIFFVGIIILKRLFNSFRVKLIWQKTRSTTWGTVTTWLPTGRITIWLRWSKPASNLHVQWWEISWFQIRACIHSTLMAALWISLLFRKENTFYCSVGSKVDIYSMLAVGVFLSVIMA